MRPPDPGRPAGLSAALRDDGPRVVHRGALAARALALDAPAARPASVSPFKGRVLRVSLTPAQSLQGAACVLSGVLLWRCWLTASAELLLLAALTVSAWYFRSDTRRRDVGNAHADDTQRQRVYPASCLRDRRAGPTGAVGKRVRFDATATGRSEARVRGVSISSDRDPCDRRPPVRPAEECSEFAVRVRGDGCDRPVDVREAVVADMASAIHPALGGLLDAVVPREGLVGWSYEAVTGAFHLALARPLVGRMSGVGPLGMRLADVVSLHVATDVRGRVSGAGSCVDFDGGCLRVKVPLVPEIGVGRLVLEDRGGDLHLRHMGWSLSGDQIRETVKEVAWQ
eukprot:Opistho-1_new@62536